MSRRYPCERRIFQDNNDRDDRGEFRPRGSGGGASGRDDSGGGDLRAVLQNWRRGGPGGSHQNKGRQRSHHQQDYRGSSRDYYEDERHYDGGRRPYEDDRRPHRRVRDTMSPLTKRYPSLPPRDRGRRHHERPRQLSPLTKRYPTPPPREQEHRSRSRSIRSRSRISRSPRMRSGSPEMNNRPRFVEAARPASPLTLEEDAEMQRRKEEERERRRKEREREEAMRREQEEREKAALDDLEEVDDIAIKVEDDDRASLGSLPSVKEEDNSGISDDALDGLGEVENIVIKVENDVKAEDVDDDRASLGSLPSVEDGRRPEFIDSPERFDDSRDGRGSGSYRREPSWEGRREVRVSRSPRREVRFDRGDGEFSNVSERRRPQQHRQQQPLRPCLICQSTEHKAKECPDLVCYKCQQKGHFAKECMNPPVPRQKPQQQLNQQPSFQQQSDQSFASEDSASKPPPKCFNCKELGHHIKQCPTLFCKKCGGKGHFAKECVSESVPSTSSGFAGMIPPAPNIGSLDGVWSGDIQRQRPTISLLEHFGRRLLRRGRDPALAEQMVLTWRAAGHTEETLWGLFRRENPSSRAQWRLVLLEELSHMRAAQIPPAVAVGDLMDETVAYHMPEENDGPSTNSRSDFSSSFQNSIAETSGSLSQVQLPSQSQLQSALNTVSSMERFKELDQSILRHSSQDPRMQDEYEGRLLSLVPVRDYIAGKMRVMSAMFGISESYIHSVSTTIQKLMAHVDLSLYALKRSYSMLGNAAVGEQLRDKLEPYSRSFPKGVTVDYIVSMVGDFLRDESQR